MTRQWNGWFFFYLPNIRFIWKCGLKGWSEGTFCTLWWIKIYFMVHQTIECLFSILVTKEILFATILNGYQFLVERKTTHHSSKGAAGVQKKIIRCTFGFSALLYFHLHLKQCGKNWRSSIFWQMHKNRFFGWKMILAEKYSWKFDFIFWK